MPNVYHSITNKQNETTKFTIIDENVFHKIDDGYEGKKLRWSKKEDRDMYKTLWDIAQEAGVPLDSFLIKEKRIPNQK